MVRVSTAPGSLTVVVEAPGEGLLPPEVRQQMSDENTAPKLGFPLTVVATERGVEVSSSEGEWPGLVQSWVVGGVRGLRLAAIRMSWEIFTLRSLSTSTTLREKLSNRGLLYSDYPRLVSAALTGSAHDGTPLLPLPGTGKVEVTACVELAPNVWRMEVRAGEEQWTIDYTVGLDTAEHVLPGTVKVQGPDRAKGLALADHATRCLRVHLQEVGDVVRSNTASKDKGAVHGFQLTPLATTVLLVVRVVLPRLLLEKW